MADNVCMHKSLNIVFKYIVILYLNIVFKYILVLEQQ